MIGYSGSVVACESELSWTTLYCTCVLAASAKGYRKTVYKSALENWMDSEMYLKSRRCDKLYRGVKDVETT